MEIKLLLLIGVTNLHGGENNLMLVKSQTNFVNGTFKNYLS